MKWENHIYNVIHESFMCGKDFRIGHFNVISEDVIVGDGVDIQNFVLLKKGTRIGNNVYVDSYFHSSGDNQIGDRVTFRFNVAIARKVSVRDGAYISPNVMTVYNTHERKQVGGIVIGEGAFIGANVVINAGIIIGPRVVIGAGAVVTKDCLEEGIYAGIPAKRID